MTSRSRLLRCVLLLSFAFIASPRVHAQGGCITGSLGCNQAPELDPALAGEAIAILAPVTLLVRRSIRGRRRSRS